MGSAACWYLARRGQRVLGLEQFTTPHENGSHAGQSRIIRKAYFEHADYVPLLERAYENWRSFEVETGQSFYYRTGIVYVGRSGNENISGIRYSAGIHGIPIENWDPEKLERIYPAFKIPRDFDVIFEPDAGFVTPEQAIGMYVEKAVLQGAHIRTHTPVVSWRHESSRIRVVTPREEFSSDKLVITAGAWTSRLVPAVASNLTVTRQVLAWVSPPAPGSFSMGKFPCWFVEDPALGTFYGFPLLPQDRFEGPIGLKLAHHYPGERCAPEELHADVPASELEKLRYFLRTYMPDAGEKIVATRNCLYTNSPDSHFMIDLLPGYDGRVAIACGFSGHGFKFVPAVGEILADLAMKGRTDLPIGFLRLRC